MTTPAPRTRLTRPPPSSVVAAVSVLLILAATRTTTAIVEDEESKQDGFHSVKAVEGNNEACRYKVWYLESCDAASHSQIVHLILSKGGTECEIAKHLTRVCEPTEENRNLSTPDGALFKDMLDGKERSKEALEKAINQTDPNDLPAVLSDGSNQTVKDAVEETLLKEIDQYDLAKVEADPMKFVKQLEEEQAAEERASSGKQAMAEALAELLKEKMEKASATSQSGQRSILGNQDKMDQKSLLEVKELLEGHDLIDKTATQNVAGERDLLNEIERDLKDAVKSESKANANEGLTLGDVFANEERRVATKAPGSTEQSSESESILNSEGVNEDREEWIEDATEEEEDIVRNVKMSNVNRNLRGGHEISDGGKAGLNVSAPPVNLYDDYAFKAASEEEATRILPHAPENETTRELLLKLLKENTTPKPSKMPQTGPEQVDKLHGVEKAWTPPPRWQSKKSKYSSTEQTQQKEHYSSAKEEIEQRLRRQEYVHSENTEDTRRRKDWKEYAKAVEGEAISKAAEKRNAASKMKANAEQLEEDASHIVKEAKDMKTAALLRDALAILEERKQRRLLKRANSNRQTSMRNEMRHQQDDYKQDSAYGERESRWVVGARDYQGGDRHSDALYSRRGTKIINWMIQNMPEGKQTVVIL